MKQALLTACNIIINKRLPTDLQLYLVLTGISSSAGSHIFGLTALPADSSGITLTTTIPGLIDVASQIQTLLVSIRLRIGTHKSVFRSIYLNNFLL